MPPFPSALFPTPCLHTSTHTPLRSQCKHVLLLQTFLLHLPRFKPPNGDLGWSGGVGTGLLLGRGITGGLEHKLFHHAQPSSMVLGWAGLAAGSRGGKDYFPDVNVQWGEVSAMGRGETAKKLSLQEGSLTSIEEGLSRAGISPRATMRQGVDQHCRIRG
jgi:hypothetical protein